MSWQARHSAALVAVLLCAAPAAHAEEEPFAVNTWIGGSAIHSGSFGVALGYAPGGSIQRSGLRWQAVALRGFYRYPSDAAPRGSVHGRYTEFSVLLGYEVVADGHGFMVGIGPSLHDKDLSYVAPGERTGSRFGAKVAALGYVSPANAPSVFGYGSYSSSDRTLNLYANLGFGLPSDLSIGPEVALLDASDYRQTRVGLHLSGLRVGRVRAGLSVGTTKDQDGNRGNHFGVNARMMF